MHESSMAPATRVSFPLRDAYAARVTAAAASRAGHARARALLASSSESRRLQVRPQTRRAPAPASRPPPHWPLRTPVLAAARGVADTAGLRSGPAAHAVTTRVAAGPVCCPAVTARAAAQLSDPVAAAAQVPLRAGPASTTQPGHPDPSQFSLSSYRSPSHTAGGRSESLRGAAAAGATSGGGPVRVAAQGSRRTGPRGKLAASDRQS